MIFDTDILIWLLRDHPNVTEFVEAIPFGERNLSAISHLELLYGCQNSTEKAKVKALLMDLFSEVIPINETITKEAQGLMERYALSRRPDPDDVLIAATALERAEPVATGNLKHFGFIPGLIIKPFRG